LIDELFGFSVVSYQREEVCRCAMAFHPWVNSSAPDQNAGRRLFRAYISLNLAGDHRKGANDESTVDRYQLV